MTERGKSCIPGNDHAALVSSFHESAVIWYGFPGFGERVAAQLLTCTI
jgi:hypothetical protein